MRARSEIYDKNIESVYHCWSRCVRRAFLCGDDDYTGKNYDHRKVWLEELLELAAACFVIDVIAFSILSNHFHIELRNRPDRRKKLTPTQIARRWLILYPKRRDAHGKACEPTQMEIKQITRDASRVEELRKRLADISWMLGYVKERLSRVANKEDDVTGAFWEKRFEMRRLFTDNAVLACAIYIDLNPIRADVAQSPESSRHTSAFLRIQGILARQREEPERLEMPDRWLAPIDDVEVPESQRFAERGCRATDDPGLAIPLTKYLELLDWSGRQSRADKRGKIPDELAPILERLGINKQSWLEVIRDFTKLFRRVAGDPDAVEQHAATQGRHWFQGIENCRRCFGRDQE